MEQSAWQLWHAMRLEKARQHRQELLGSDCSLAVTYCMCEISRVRVHNQGTTQDVKCRWCALRSIQAKQLAHPQAALHTSTVGIGARAVDAKKYERSQLDFSYEQKQRTKEANAQLFPDEELRHFLKLITLLVSGILFGSILAFVSWVYIAPLLSERPCVLPSNHLSPLLTYRSNQRAKLSQMQDFSRYTLACPWFSDPEHFLGVQEDDEQMSENNSSVPVRAVKEESESCRWQILEAEYKSKIESLEVELLNSRSKHQHIITSNEVEVLERHAGKEDRQTQSYPNAFKREVQHVQRPKLCIPTDFWKEACQEEDTQQMFYSRDTDSHIVDEREIQNIDACNDAGISLGDTNDRRGWKCRSVTTELNFPSRDYASSGHDAEQLSLATDVELPAENEAEDVQNPPKAYSSRSFWLYVAMHTLQSMLVCAVVVAIGGCCRFLC